MRGQRFHVALGTVTGCSAAGPAFLSCSTQWVAFLSGGDVGSLAGCTSMQLSCLALRRWSCQRLVSIADCHRGLQRPPCDHVDIGLIPAAKHRRTPVLRKACPATREELLYNGTRVGLDDLQNAVLVAITEMDAVCCVQQEVRSVFCQPLTGHPLGLKSALLKLFQNHMLGACHQIHVHQRADVALACAILSHDDLEGCQTMPVWAQAYCKEARRQPGCFAVTPIVHPAAYVGAPALILALKHQHASGMGQEQALIARPHL